jgi:hypothetical protein
VGKSSSAVLAAKEQWRMNSGNDKTSCRLSYYAPIGDEQELGFETDISDRVIALPRYFCHQAFPCIYFLNPGA